MEILEAFDLTRCAWLLRDTLNGDDQAHDRGDHSGPVRPVNNQA
jgi:hypothetical protein